MLAKMINGRPLMARGKILRNGKLIISNPREEDFIEAGYKPVEDNKIADKEGFERVPEYTETEEKIIINYHYEELTDEESIA
jgi:hypothetical protein